MSSSTGAGPSPGSTDPSPEDGRWKRLVDVLELAGRKIGQDNVTDWAAALTYYGVLAIFPALIALISIVGLLGDSVADPLLENVESVAPGPAKDIFTGAINNLRQGQSTAGILFVVGLVAALWSASAYVGAFMRASNAIHGVGQDRPIYKALPIRLATTVVLLVLLIVIAFGVAATGGVAEQIGNVFGLGDVAVTAWGYAKWPVLMILVSFLFAFLYWIAPNVERQPLRMVTAGGAVGVAIWLVASALFSLYVANFSSYDKTYGALGGVVTFLVWLWVSNMAILLGAEVNAELERRRAGRS